MSQSNTLKDLLVDEDSLNETLLTEVLSPYIGIGNSSGALVPKEEFKSLSSTGQTVVVLLYQKAAYELGLAENEGATPMEISEASGINHSTVKGVVRELDEMDLVVNEDGNYSIPTYNYELAKELLQEGKDEH